jgi:hypothetical protein
MIRGSTPTHTFNCKLDPELIHKVRVLYSQNNVLVLKKEDEDCEKDGQTIIVKLSQEDTLKFKEGKVEIQLRVLTSTGESIPSKIHTVNVNKLLENEVFV